MKALFIIVVYANLFCSLQLKCGELLFKSDHQKGGWRGFGTGFSDSAVNLRLAEIQIEANWQTAAWGLGIMFILDPPCDGQKIKAIRAKIKSTNGSGTGLYIGLENQNGVRFELDRKKTLKITDSWQFFEFPIRRLETLQHGPNAQVNQENSLQNITIVKFLFAKPADKSIPKDVIFVRKPEIILFEQ